MIEKNSKMDFWFVACMFRERNKYFAKICKKLEKHQQKFNKKNEMITRKIKRG